MGDIKMARNDKLSEKALFTMKMGYIFLMGKENYMRRFINRVFVTMVAGAMLAGNVSSVSANQLYDARYVYADVDAGGLDAALQDTVGQKVLEYDVKDLEVAARWGAEDSTDDSGNYQVVFPKQYAQIYYRIPAEIDVTKLISVNVETEASSFSMKLCADRDNYASAIDVYHTTQINTADIKESANAKLSEVSILGFMSLLKDDEGQLTKTVGKVKFVVESADSGNEDGNDNTGDDEADKTEFTYQIAELTALAKWGASTEVLENGKLQVTFPEQYNQIFFKIPDEVDMSRFLSATVDTDKGKLSVKLCVESDYNTSGGVVYENNVITANDLSGDVENSRLRVLCLMSLSADELVKEVGNITIKLSPKSQDAEKTEFKYNLSELELKTAWDVETAAADEGACQLTFRSKYSQIFYVIPDEVNMEMIDYVSVDTTAEQFSVKLSANDDSFTEGGAVYGSTMITDDDLNGNVAKPELKILVLMSLSDGELVKNVKSVTFKLKNTGSGSENLLIEQDVPNLKDVVTADMEDENFIVGTAICLNDLKDENEMALVKKHFNAITLGNELKPDAAFGYASKCPDTETAQINGVEITVPKLDFSRADKMLEYVYAYNEEHPEAQIKIRGHVFTWHSQTPEWFFHENYDADAALCSSDEMTLRHEWYIKTMAEHYMGTDSKYKDMFYGWDVVNEAVSDSRGTYRNGNENSTWWKVYKSNEYIINAFRFANKYVPANVELYYNDYGDCSALKSEGIAQLLKDVKAAEGTRLDAVGMQAHYQTSGSPSAEEFITAAKKYAECGVKIQITELDFKASDAFDGTDATLQEEYTRLAYRYKEIYDAVKQLKSEGVPMAGITVWGVIDKNSWLQTSSSVGGGADGSKKQVPLLFDDNYKVKGAYWAFVDSTKLAPTIKEVSFTKQIDDDFTAGTELTVNKGDLTAIISPAWNDTSITFLADVKDSTVDDTDSVSAYVKVGKEVKKAVVKRADSTATENGYTAKVVIDGLELKTFDDITFDVVVTDGEIKTAFNDYTLSQNEKSDYYAKAQLKPFVKIANGTIKVGEDNSKIWSQVDSIPLSIVLDAKAEGNAKLLWDNDYLYVQMTVKDATLDASAEAAHEKDSVEVFIDENNQKSKSYQEDDKQYRINYLNEHTFNGTNCVEENIVSDITLTDDGYVMEAAIKWTHEKVEAGKKIGLELQVNDAEGGKRIGTVSWSDTTGMGWSSPEVFGTAVLSGEKVEAPEEKPTETPTEEPTEKPSEPETEVPTEEPSEPETEAPTEKPSEPETEAPTHNPSESETEAPTQDDKAVSSSVLDRINNGDKIIIEKVEAGKGSYLPNDFVTALISKGSQLILELTGTDGKTLAKYTLDGTKFNKAPDTDLKLDVRCNDKSNIINKVKEQLNVPETSLYLCSFAHSGELNGELYVTVYTQYEEGTELRLFYYNDNTGSSEDMGQTVKAAQDGSVTFRVTHFSSYILVKAADIRNDITPGETETQPAQPETDKPEEQYIAPSTGVNISSALYAAALVCVIIMLCSAAGVCIGRRKKQ